MTLKEIFDYPLIATSKINLSASDLISAFLIILFAAIISKCIKHYFRRRVRDNRLDKSNAYAVEKLSRYVLWIFAIVIALDSAGIKMSILLAGSAALMVGIGLGLQQIFKDLVSGVFILFEQNIRIGDSIQFDDKTRGIVKSIGVRTSKIVTAENHLLIVPNSLIIGDTLINWTGGEQLKIRGKISVGVSYNSDIKLVEKLLLDCTQLHHKVDNKEPSFVRLSDFANSAILFEVYFWVEEANSIEDIKSDIRFLIFETFAKNNIEIPFPQLDIHQPSGQSKASQQSSAQTNIES